MLNSSMKHYSVQPFLLNILASGFLPTVLALTSRLPPAPAHGRAFGGNDSHRCKIYHAQQLLYMIGLDWIYKTIHVHIVPLKPSLHINSFY